MDVVGCKWVESGLGKLTKREWVLRKLLQKKVSDSLTGVWLEIEWQKTSQLQWASGCSRKLPGYFAVFMILDIFLKFSS